MMIQLKQEADLISKLYKALHINAAYLENSIDKQSDRKISFCSTEKEYQRES